MASEPTKQQTTKTHRNIHPKSCAFVPVIEAEKFPFGKCLSCEKPVRVRNARFYCPKCDKDLGKAP